MSAYFLAVLSALWLGVLTSISPCPLAMNIAAVSFISRRISRTRRVFFTGLFYTLGRMLTYIILGVLIVTAALSIPQLSAVLQKYMNKILGPVLILVGMVLLELLKINLPSLGLNKKMQKHAESSGVFGAGFLGMIFALSFCPVSAALFLGSLIPLSVKFNSGVMLPAFYGLGTGLPVLLFAVLIAVGAKSVGEMFNKITKFELWIRRITGIIFILIGIYYCLMHVFGCFR